MRSKNVIILSIFTVLSLFLISGCSDTTTTPTGPTTGTVTGKVVDINGSPIAGVTAIIGSSNAVTGSDGSFTINSVTTSYDLKLAIASGPNPTGILYQG